MTSQTFEDLCNKLDNAGLLKLARTAESAERYPDMCILMKKLVKNKCKAKKQLEVEERNLLSVAYKNVIGSKRSSWRTLESTDTNDSEVPDWKETCKAYKEQVEIELQQICQEVIALLGPDINKTEKKDMMTFGEHTLLNTLKEVEKTDATIDETEVFYLKMIGDYCRYLSEIGNENAKAFTEMYYAEAMKQADANLAETHPTRLGLALNYSVCFYEIMKKPDEACKLAKEAFDGAIEKLDTLNDASYKDSTLIMQLLRDNLTLWTSEKTEDQADRNP